MIEFEEKSTSSAFFTKRTTIGIKQTTKGKLDRNRAPGQCYDGFLCQLVDMWEDNHKDNGGRTIKPFN